jgi:hypothetical protein
MRPSRTHAFRPAHTSNVSGESPSDRDVVIRHASIDGSIDVFEDFEEVDGYLLVSGVVEDTWVRVEHGRVV